jgi:hypothetical protein
MHGFWLAPRLTNQHLDLLAQWYPRWCYLGRSLRAGHIPTWLPYQFGGLPFASDPQSGWLYAPVMVFFSLFSCSHALGLVIVSHPLVAGLGFYLFLRNERLGRPAATVGGLTLSLSMVGSVMVLTMPFAAMLAWTSVALAGASGFLRAKDRSSAVAWFALASFGLAQVATAHLTNGLLMAALVVGLYLVATVAGQARRRGGTLSRTIGRSAALVVTFPVLAAAVLIPRLAYLPRTSIGHGYVELSRIASQLSGQQVHPPFAGRGHSLWWATGFARTPGGYVGVLAIVLVGVAFASPRWRFSAAAFGVVGLIGYVLNLNLVVRAKAIRSLAAKHWLGELWLRDPERFRYLLLLSFAALAGYGVQAWIDRGRAHDRATLLRRMAWLAPPILVFVALPALAGAPGLSFLALLLALAAVLPVLTLVARGRTAVVWLLPLLVAVELTATGLVDLLPPPRRAAVASATGSHTRFATVFAKLRRPGIDPDAYLTPGEIGRHLVEGRRDYGRYLTLEPAIARSPRGFLTHQDAANWPAYENGRSILFRIDEVQGYLPVQLDRYWRLVRRVDPTPIFYNAATFQVAPPEVLRLFGVRWLVTPTNQTPPPDGVEIVREGRYTLYRLTDAEPRASVVFSWKEAPADVALDDVLRPGFDPAREAVVEDQPTVGGRPLAPTAAGQATAAYSEVNPQHARIRVTTTQAGLVVIRNMQDKNWRATLDGRRVALIATDYLLQGVAVPAGAHVVDVTYQDRPLGFGLAISAAAWMVLLALFAWFTIAERRSAHGDPA